MDWYSFLLGVGTTILVLIPAIRLRGDDDAFWIRQYAGQAMQGILANNKLLSAFVSTGETIGMEQLAAVSKGAVAQAKALLEEVKKHERS